MNLRRFAVIGMIILAMLAIYAGLSQGGGALSGKEGAANNSRPEPITYSELLTAIQQDRIKGVEVQGETLTGEFKDETKFESVTPMPNADLIAQIQATGAEVKVKSMRQPLWMSILLGLLPIFVLVGLFLLITRQMQGGARGAMGFGKSKAKLLT